MHTILPDIRTCGILLPNLANMWRSDEEQCLFKGGIFIGFYYFLRSCLSSQPLVVVLTYGEHQLLEFIHHVTRK